MTQHSRGFSLALAIACLSVLAMIVLAIASITGRERSILRDDAERLQAAWLAEAGVERAAAQLAVDTDYTGESWTIEPALLDGAHGATISITVETQNPENRLVHIRAVYPAHSQRPKQSRKDFTIHLKRLKEQQ